MAQYSKSDTASKKGKQLQERQKELRLIYELPRLLKKKKPYQAVLDAIPAAFQYPQDTCARLTLKSETYTSEGFKVSSHVIKEKLKDGDDVLGLLEVFVKKGGKGTSSLFLDEEKRLLKSVAAHISLFSVYSFRTKESEKVSTKYQTLFSSMIDGFAYNKIITKHGKPVDYVFLEVNSAFERLTGIKNPVGKKVTEVLPNIGKDSFDWIGTYGNIALNGGTVRLQQYAESLGKWYDVAVYSPRKGYFVTMISDITKSKELQQKLIDADQVYSVVAKETATIIYDFDLHTGNIKWRGAITKVTGYASDVFDLNIYKWEEHLHPADRNTTVAHLAYCIEHNQDFRAKYRFRNKDGEYRWIQESGTLITIGGNPHRMVGSMRDITPSENARREMVRLKAAFENSAHSMMFISYEGNVPTIQDVNKSFTRYYQYSPDEVIGKSPRILKSGLQTKDYYKKMWSQVLDPNVGTWTDVLFNKRKDGSLIEVILSVTTLFDSNNNPVGFVANHVDVTKEKKKERELEESEQRYRTLAENMHDGIVILDKNMRILYANPSAAKMVGVKNIQDYIGRSVRSFIVPSLRKDAKKDLQRVFRNKESKIQEIQITTLSGKKKWLSTFDTRIRYAGVSADLVVLQDMTQHKKNLERIQKEQKFTERLIQGLPGIFFVLDTSGKLVRWNEKLARTLNKKANRLKSMPLINVIAQDTKKEFKEFISTIQKSGQGHIRSDLITSKKETAPFYLSIVRVGKGDDALLIGIGVSLSEQQKLEEELKISTKMRKAIIDKAPFGMYVVNSKGTVDYANEAMADITGTTTKNFEGLDLLGLTSYKQHGLDALIGKGLEGEPFHIEKLDYVSTLGKKHTIRNMTGIPLHEGNIRKLLVIVEDITEQETLKENMRDRTHQLEQFNRLAVGRELKMIELKQQIAELQRKAGGSGAEESSMKKSSKTHASKPSKQRTTSSGGRRT